MGLAADARGQAQTKDRDIFPDDAVREKPSAASQIEDIGSGIEEGKEVQSELKLEGKNRD
jgi:hypothetical protein